MTEQPDIIALLQRALDQAGSLIASIAPEQRGLPTPCADWDVRTLVTHVVGGVDNFTVATRGGQPDWSAPHPALGDDWPAAFNANKAALLDAWSGADAAALPRADQQITELAVHSWDIACAVGQQAALDPQIAEHALEWSSQALKPEFRGSAIGAEVPVRDDAPVYDRLAGWFGRDPAPWSARG
jgi:uncharacterized protein (TIGR03086 family)